jgi:predicted RecA/RadA family phage recombinase
MPEALFLNGGFSLDYTPDAAVLGGEVRQIPDGRAGVCVVDEATGKVGTIQVHGIYTLAKTANVNILAGGRVYWDHSANTATYKPVNDRDFYVGVAVEDSLTAATTVKVDLNQEQVNVVDLVNTPFLSVPTGTQVVGAFGHLKPYGSSRSFALTATSEVQCIDALSVDRFSKDANAIAEIIFRLGTNGSTSDVDLNFGIANGTSTSDADATTEHVFFHIDGGSLVINAQSKDGVTTVAAATTGVSATAGSAVSDRVECWIDTRDTTSVKLYVNGARVLSGSTFRIDGATGPFGVLAHLEKATGTATAGPIFIDRLCARLMQQ